VQRYMHSTHICAATFIVYCYRMLSCSIVIFHNGQLLLNNGCRSEAGLDLWQENTLGWFGLETESFKWSERNGQKNYWVGLNNWG